MASYLNTLGAVSRRGQWRFRQILRSQRADGRLDTSDAGLIDFATTTAFRLTVTPRRPARPWGGDWQGCSDADCEPAPVLTASYPDGDLIVSNPGIVEAVFPAGSLLAFPAGIYDVRLFVTVGPETEEIFSDPIEFA